MLIDEFHIANELRGWKLRAASAVSGDGSTVVGFGLNRHGNQEAWIARIAEPAMTRFSKQRRFRASADTPIASPATVSSSQTFSN